MMARMELDFPFFREFFYDIKYEYDFGRSGSERKISIWILDGNCQSHETFPIPLNSVKYEVLQQLF